VSYGTKPFASHVCKQISNRWGFSAKKWQEGEFFYGKIENFLCGIFFLLFRWAFRVL